jgi:hypothetical protein
MADKLLRWRGGCTGKNCVDRFVERTPELRTKWSRPYDCQRATRGGLAVIRSWFELFWSMKEKYGIADEDV